MFGDTDYHPLDDDIRVCEVDSHFHSFIAINKSKNASTSFVGEFDRESVEEVLCEKCFSFFKISDIRKMNDDGNFKG